MKGIIAFSLYGKDVRYCAGALANLRDAATYYPGWRIAVCMERDHFMKKQCSELTGGAFVVEHDPEEGISPMFWRMGLAVNTCPVIFRDLDSRFSERETAAVEEWLASDKKFHTMRDHEHHYGFPMLGGMWGVKGGIEKIERLIEEWKKTHSYTKYGDDQAFLRDVVWPMAQEAGVMVHGERNKGAETPFPKPIDRVHVGGYAKVEMKDAITAAFVINPDRYKKRMERFLPGLAPSKILSGFEYRRWNWPGPGEVFEPQNLSKDWVGPHFWRATLGHIALFNKAWQEGHPAILVLEDDVIPVEGCDEILQAAWDDLPPGWLALHLASHQEMPLPEVTPNLRRDTGTFDSWGYIWSREGIEAVLQAFYDDFFCHVVDVVKAHLQVTSGRMYTPRVWPLRQAEGPQFGSGE